MVEAVAPAEAQEQYAPSEYADLAPALTELSGLPDTDPRRAELREEIVLALLPVVQHLAARHGRGHPQSREELEQVGAVGLLGAIDRWNPERSPSDVLGYVIVCVRGEILRYFRDRTWSTRVPRRLKDLGVAIGQATGPLSQQLGRAPRPSELATHLGADINEVVEALHAQDSRRAGSLDAATDSDGLPLTDRLGEVDPDIEHVEYRHALKPLLERLPERERTILILRFFREQTQTQIAEQVGISQMHVSRLLARTLTQLRSALLDDSPPT
jgi:RNA polymerase sigma-B factor